MKRIGVYFLYNENDDIIYIGKSSNLDKRIKTSFRLKDAEYVRVAEVKNKIDATIYESYYIAKFKPILNKYYSDFNSSSLKLPELKFGDKINSKDILTPIKTRKKKYSNSTNIKTLRKHLRLTQIEFAELIGTTQMTISTWENGKCPEYIDKLAEMALKGSAQSRTSPTT